MQSSLKCSGVMKTEPITMDDAKNEFCFFKEWEPAAVVVTVWPPEEEARPNMNDPNNEFYQLAHWINEGNLQGRIDAPWDPAWAREWERRTHGKMALRICFFFEKEEDAALFMLIWAGEHA